MNVIIDTSVLMYAIDKAIPRIHLNKREKITKSVLVYIDSLEWLTCNEPARAIWVMDVKYYEGTYWRQNWLDSHGYNIRYKHGRKSKSESLLDIITYSRDFLDKYCRVLSCRGFEADDLAGMVVKASNERNVLMTIDTDWIGLVDEKTDWINFHSRWQPRIRDDIESINQWASKARAIQKTTLDYPSQIWEIKARIGDKSDSLPANSPIEVISLLKPGLEVPLEVLDKYLQFDYQPNFDADQIKYAKSIMACTSTHCPIEPLTR